MQRDDKDEKEVTKEHGGAKSRMTQHVGERNFLYSLPDSLVLSLRDDAPYGEYPAAVFDFANPQEEMTASNQHMLPLKSNVFFCSKTKNIFCRCNEYYFDFQFFQINQGKIVKLDFPSLDLVNNLKDFRDLHSLLLFDDGIHFFGRFVNHDNDSDVFIYNLLTRKVYILGYNLPISACILAKNKLILGTRYSGVFTFDFDFSLESKGKSKDGSHMITHENSYSTGRSIMHLDVSPDEQYLLTVSDPELLKTKMTIWKINISSESGLELTKLYIKIPIAADSKTYPSFAADGSIMFLNRDRQLCRAVIVPNQPLQIEELKLIPNNPMHFCCLSDGRTLCIDNAGNYNLVPALLYLQTYNRIINQFLYGQMTSSIAGFSHDLTSMIASYAAFYPAHKVPTDPRTFLMGEIEKLARSITLARDKNALKSVYDMLKAEPEKSFDVVFDEALKKHRHEISNVCEDFLRRLAVFFKPGVELKLTLT